MSAAQRGVTTVSDRVAAKIARQAADEVAIPGGGHVLRSTAHRTGGSVEMIVEVDLPASTLGNPGRMAHFHAHVTERTRSLTGLVIAPVYVRVRKVTPEPGRTCPAVTAPAESTARRPWSRRRAPAAGLGAFAAALSVLLMWTLCRPYVPGIPPPPWNHVAEAAHVVERWSVVRPAAALAVAVAGGWLLCLAVTPGHRGALALGCPQPIPVRARTTRTHAARLVRAAVADVPGLRVRRVRFRARKITVRAHVAFGDPQELREAANEMVSRTIGSMGLARTPTVRLVLAGAPEAPATRTARPREEGADE
ncbi:DUF6286 domain-containing protein [Streptomyces vinaceus]|uniref:DUF6286 domain-containing protein n=1 Tax=Streptomyces vinaceus TaxID=1960 RepID=UPI0037F9756D